MIYFIYIVLVYYINVLVIDTKNLFGDIIKFCRSYKDVPEEYYMYIIIIIVKC